MQTSVTTDRPLPNGAPPASQEQKENRRIQRIALPLPVRVEVKLDAETTWYEITRLDDVSAFGAGFVLKRPIKRGRLVVMTIPMPRQLRSFDYSEPQYRVWGLVRRCIAIGNSRETQYSIGVAFVGKTPPADYNDHPSRLYDISHQDADGRGFWHIGPADLLGDDRGLPADQRRQTRYAIPESLTLQQTDEKGNVLMSETTVTENISLGGAAVFTTLQIEPGTFLRVRSEVHNIEILSVVRRSRVGEDGITRLHIEFIDRYYPLEGLE
jgi:hypothetical protein